MKKILLLLTALFVIVTGCSSDNGGEPYAPYYNGGNNYNGGLTEPYADNGVPGDDTAAAYTGTGGVRLSFLAAGDNIIHESVFRDAARRAAPGQRFNFLPMYEGIAHLIAAADIAFVNQESPIAASRQFYGFPNFNSPREAGDTLVELGFNIINFANNHMLDMREVGFVESIEYWRTQPVTLLGVYTYDSFDDVTVIEREGISIAFLTYTFGLNGMSLSPGSNFRIPLINDEDITRRVAIAKERADLVFVSMHWGNEHGHYQTNIISNEQRRLAQLMVDAGVDVIIGHHPHVLQDLRWVNRPDGGRTLIKYSLGNLISTMHPHRCMVGGLLTFDIVRENADEQPTIENVRLIPIMTHYSMQRDALQVYLLEDYTDELVAAHGSQLQGAFTMADLHGHVTSVIPPEFLPDFLR